MNEPKRTGKVVWTTFLEFNKAFFHVSMFDEDRNSVIQGHKRNNCRQTTTFRNMKESVNWRW